MVMACHLQKEGHDIHLLHVDYGQVTAPAEQNAVSYLARHLALQPPIFIDVRSMSAWGSGSLVEDSADTEFFPHRNLFLLSCGAVVSAKLNCEALAIGVYDVQQAPYADCRKEFLNRMAHTLEGDEPRLQLSSPLGDLSKIGVVNLGLSLMTPLVYSFSCNRMGHRHCWACSSCQDRVEAFTRAGIDL